MSTHDKFAEVSSDEEALPKVSKLPAKRAHQSDDEGSDDEAPKKVAKPARAKKDSKKDKKKKSSKDKKKSKGDDSDSDSDYSGSDIGAEDIDLSLVVSGRRQRKTVSYKEPSDVEEDEDDEEY
jgi:hypothetical protein